MLAIWLAVGVLASGGGETPPDPEPTPTTTNLGRGHRVVPRLMAVIDGQRVIGSRDEIMALLALQARKDAEQLASQASKTKTREAARRAARKTAPRVELVDPWPENSAPMADMTAHLQRLQEIQALARAEYMRQYVAEALLIHQSIEDDNQAAMAAAELML